MITSQMAEVVKLAREVAAFDTRVALASVGRRDARAIAEEVTGPLHALARAFDALDTYGGGEAVPT